MKKFFSIAGILLLLATNVQAATIEAVQDLSFGTLIPENSSGAVTMSTSGTINTGGSASIAPSGDSYFQGIVKFTPNIISIFRASVDDAEIVLTNEKGNTVTVDNFTVYPTDISVQIVQPFYVNIGGQMHFNSASSSGTYTGTVTVTVTRVLGPMSVQLPVKVTLWDRLAIEETSNLSFGTLLVNSGASVIRLAPETGSRSIISGGDNVTLDSSSVVSNGKFAVQGQANASVSVSLPDNIQISGANGGVMTVNNFSAYPSATSISLDASGKSNLLVGADLNIASNQPSGNYEGTYSVTVNY